MVYLFVYQSMVISTTSDIKGKTIIKIHGIARGNTVRARNLGKDIWASLKNIVGGEIDEYTRLQAQSREQAIQRMTADANSMGANGIVNVRITTSMIMQGCSEIMAYGTAVTLEQMDNSEMIFSIVIWLVIIISLIYLLVRKIIKEENEDYENRDNQLITPLRQTAQDDILCGIQPHL